MHFRPFSFCARIYKTPCYAVTTYYWLATKLWFLLLVYLMLDSTLSAAFVFWHVALLRLAVMYVSGRQICNVFKGQADQEDPSFWTALPLKIVTICCRGTSVTNYQATAGMHPGGPKAFTTPRRNHELSQIQCQVCLVHCYLPSLLWN
jgi:hypothetical protein